MTTAIIPLKKSFKIFSAGLMVTIKMVVLVV